MVKSKWWWGLNIIYAVVTILTLIYTIDKLVYAAQYPSVSNMLYIEFPILCIGILYSPLFIAEYVMCPHPKYILFA